MARSAPLSASHSLMVLSLLRDAIRFPSGLNATLRIEPVCPLSVASWAPLAASHNLMVLSAHPDAIRFPSGLNATPQTTSAWPLSVDCSVPGLSASQA